MLLKQNADFERAVTTDLAPGVVKGVLAVRDRPLIADMNHPEVKKTVRYAALSHC